MPITASAKKSLRVGLRRAQENKALRIRVKNQLKNPSKETLGATFSLLDKAAKNHVIHANKAARIKSRLSKTLLTPTPKVEAPAAKAKAPRKRAAKPKAKA